MTEKTLSRVVIVGGGTAGWVAAAALSKLMGKVLDVTLIESDEIGTVGVGEATIPQIRRLNAILGINEDDFVAKTNGSFKLGIEFVNWGQLGEKYIHTFGDVGINLNGLQFHHYWLRHHHSGGNKNLKDYSLHTAASHANKFGRMERVGNTSMTGLAYAFHFDAALYAAYLRNYSENLGTKRVEGKIVDVNLDGESGHINSVTLERGETIEGDFFIDCSGFRGLLIGQALGVAYRDWSKYLPCNRAVAVPCESVTPLTPYTRSTAHSAGWQWRIPLQHRTGNGHVFSVDYMSEQDATDILMSNLDGTPLADPRVIRFTTGHRESFWAKNCVALGLASGFLEPLESTSIHLVQSNVSRLIQLFPRGGIDQSAVDEYNRITIEEFNTIRDFLILHYHLTRRTDSDFWNYCRTMDVPDSLKHKMQLFQECGRLYHDPDDLFRETSWVQVMMGQGLLPRDYSPIADAISDEDLSGFLGSVEKIIHSAVDTLPDHAEFIRKTAPARL